MPGQVGNAFSFNVFDRYLQLPDNFLPFPTTGGTSTNPLSFAVWFRTTIGGVILGQQEAAPLAPTTSNFVPAVYVGTDGRLRAQLFWNGSRDPVTSPNAVTDGQFHFLAMSSDGQTQSVYLDNQLIGTRSGMQVGYAPTYHYQLGTGYTTGWPAANGGWDSYSGLLDEVQFFNRAITPAEIAAIYNAGSAGEVKGVRVLPVPSISGTVFDDQNGDGTRQAGEPGLPGWTAYLDLNNNGTRDNASGTFSSADVPLAIPDLGTVFSSLVVPASVGTVADVNLAFHLTHTFVGDLEIYLISPDNTRVLLVNRVGFDGDNFGDAATDTVLDDQAAPAIDSGAAPFLGSWRPSNPLSAFNGLAGAGTWRLEIQDRAPEDVGTLIRWSLAISELERGAPTDAQGNYTLANLGPGTYTVRQAPQAGWTQTAPAGGAHTVTLAAGQLATGRDFGNRQTFQVTSVTPTNSGFAAVLNRAFDPSMLNLYDTQTGGLGAADVTLVGASTGPVTGSLILRPDHQAFTFIRTGGVLPADTYTVTLRSAANGFKDTTGGLLDGNADGTTGDHYTSAFTVSPSTAVGVSIPDFTRGPGQAVDVPATSTGLPLRLSEGNGVRTVTATVLYNPALLSITGATLGSGIPAGSTVMADTTQPGVATVTFTSPTPLGPGVLAFVQLTASVPNGAPYGAKQVLDVTGVVINAGAIAARDDDGIHVVAYFGDASGNGGLSAADAQRALRVAIGLDGGFGAHRLGDPRLIADINGNGRVDSTDATRILQEAVGIDRAEIPPLPSGLTITPSGPDPLLHFPTDFKARPGETLTVPLLLDPADGLETLDLAIAYDHRRLEVVAVERGALTADFDLFVVNHDAAAGTIRAGLSRTAGPIGSGNGSVLQITFRVRADAPAGRAIINLLHDLAPTQTLLNEGGLLLTPEPSN